MKLRLRSLESNQTLKIEVPNSYNINQLKQFIIQNHLSSSSSSSIQERLYLSLNRNDEISGDSPEESLQSIGLTSGDLIYYSRNCRAFSPPNPNFSNLGVSLGGAQDEILTTAQVLECGENGGNDVSGGTHIDVVSNCCGDQRLDCVVSDEFVDSGRVLVEGMSKLSEASENLGDAQMMEVEKMDKGDDDSNAVSRESLGTSNADDRKADGKKVFEVAEGSNEMEVDEDDDDDEAVGTVKSRFTVPGFLRNVYAKEVGDSAANGGDHKLLVIAVHAVLLESGFVGYDPVSGMKVDGFHLPDEWPSAAFGMSLRYTLPVISSCEVVETVVLKFQSLGKYVNVYGSLSKKGSVIHRVCLDEHRFIPALSYVWKKSDHTDSTKVYPNQEIFEFWKVVKDGLSYPLLIELCEQVGLVPPPCFMLLPTELKLKILESLPAADVAKVACVSSELQFVASNNDLWKLKYEEEFGNAACSRSESRWKAKFSSSWVARRKRKTVCVPFRWREPPLFFPGRRVPPPNPFGFPFSMWGDNDRLPAYGILQPPGRRFFGRDCDLGGFDV
ncbi:hypothetical protein vseg_018486 [Gypsophila vaccaria]